MLIASGRSKPDKHAEPRYVYPPHGPAEERLPPLPELPTPEPLPLSALGVDGAPDRLVMMWDFFNTLGPAIKLKPLGLPLEALENALLCRSPLDYDLASQLHACLLRLLIPDFDGLEGWGPWVCQGAWGPSMPATASHPTSTLLKTPMLYWPGPAH